MYRLLTPLAAGLLAGTASADVLSAVADRDATLYIGNGGLANGSGEYIFSGKTAMGGTRRALMHFDLTGIPAGSTINSVSLALDMNKTVSGDQGFDLHAVLADWGEGASDAPLEEGGGTASMPGDATWVHRHYPTCTWGTNGGLFSGTASGSATVGFTLGTYTWSGAGMVADVQSWIDGASANHGWMLKHTDEVMAATAKRFTSRDSANVAARPTLTVDYTTAAGCGAINYCGPAALNSDGCPASIFWAGSCTIATDDFTITADSLPAGQFGYFLASQTQGYACPPASDGCICLGGSIARFNQPGRIIQGPSGMVTLPLTTFPTSPPTALVPGDTWSFQCWYRDVGNTSNFTNGLQVTFD